MTSDRTFVIVGASLAGAKAAETLRAEGFDGRLVLVGAEQARPYERPPLSKDFLRGEVGPRSIAVVITVTANGNGAHHAYIDNISLTLGKATVVAGAKPALVVTCKAKTLVATVRPAKGSKVSSVTFLVNGRAVAIDKKAPFTARVGTAGLPAQLKVSARVKQAGKTATLTKSIPRC